MAARNRSVRAALPNLLNCTVYALNKSNSKRAVIGLEYYGGFYRAVVKLCSYGSPSKYVTLDPHSWELMCDQMDAMAAYLQNNYGFGNPTKLFLPNHDIHFIQSFGARSIGIDERPSVVINKLRREETQNAQPDENQQPTVSSSSSSSLFQEDEDGEPACKKKKYDNPPGITMQLPTFEGLKEVRECINARLKRAEENAGFVNRALDCLIEFLKNILNKEGTEKAKSILKDNAAFKQFYSIHNDAITRDVKTRLEYVGFSEDFLNIILLEIYAYGLPMLAKDIYEFTYNP